MKALTQQFAASRGVFLGLALVVGAAGAMSGCANVDQGVAGSSHPVKDTWITSKVKTNLATLRDIDATDIGVETNNGVVTLTGEVDSPDKRDRVVSAVRQIEGVKDVDTSMLTVMGQ